MRINVSCSRADFDAFPVSSSSRSAVHRPNFGRGWTSRSYSKDVSPDRRTLRTVLRDTLRSRAISLIVLPLIKCSRRIRAIVSTTSIPHHLLRSKAGSATGQPIGGQFWTPIPQLRGSKLHAETQGGSLRDIQMLAGHTNLRTTQRYIDANPEAQVRVVELV